MNIIIKILIFCIVLFLYLHIFFHIKTSDDLEIYEFSNVCKERLEEICDLRQPVIFDYDIQKLSDLFLENISNNYSSFDIKLRNVLNTFSLEENENDSEIYLPISLSNGIKVLSEDDSNKYISEKNMDFLQETSLIKILQSNDSFLRPYMMSSFEYDIILGSSSSITPFRYLKNYRNYFIVLSGEIEVKLTPPKSCKYLYPQYDYDNFEFRSLINPWNVQDKYKNEFNKIKCLEMKINKGKILFVPAYWWYSLKFKDSNTVVLNLNYKTYMNIIAIFPSLFISFLQKQNIKHNLIGKINN